MKRMQKGMLVGLLAAGLLVPLGATAANAATVSDYRSCSSNTVVTRATGSGVIAHAQSRNGVTKSVTISRAGSYTSYFDANFTAAGWAVSGNSLTSGGSYCG